MKKFLILFFIFILQTTAAFAAIQVKVSALKEFKTDAPSKRITVKVLNSTELGKYTLSPDDMLECDVVQIQEPQRGKRNAAFAVKAVSINSTTIDQDIYGKYSKTILSKEELKKIPPGKVLKKAALTVGSHFVKGLSTGVAFAEGVVENQDDNRLKSGVVNAYKESPLSYVEKGEELDIKPGDEFYFVFKIDEDEEPNYSYTEPAQ